MIRRTAGRRTSFLRLGRHAHLAPFLSRNVPVSDGMCSATRSIENRPRHRTRARGGSRPRCIAACAARRMRAGAGRRTPVPNLAEPQRALLPPDVGYVLMRAIYRGRRRDQCLSRRGRGCDFVNKSRLVGRHEVSRYIQTISNIRDLAGWSLVSWDRRPGADRALRADPSGQAAYFVLSAGGRQRCAIQRFPHARYVAQDAR